MGPANTTRDEPLRPAGTEAAPQQTSDVDAAPFKQFVWGAGIECSFLPHLNVDQYAWTQHDRFWREDLARAKDLGISQLRHAFPWHVLEAKRGQFDWSYADERMAEFEAGDRPVARRDALRHAAVAEAGRGRPGVPRGALESFTEAIVTRYRGQVTTWCPFNEPLVSALFSGDFGFWPPHARKWRGYMPVLSRIVQGLSRGIRTIRRVQPEATILHVDAAEGIRRTRRNCGPRCSAQPRASS